VRVPAAPPPLRHEQAGGAPEDELAVDEHEAALAGVQSVEGEEERSHEARTHAAAKVAQHAEYGGRGDGAEEGSDGAQDVVLALGRILILDVGVPAVLVVVPRQPAHVVEHELAKGRVDVEQVRASVVLVGEASEVELVCSARGGRGELGTTAVDAMQRQ
jgi:hypothetical protein